MGTQIKILAPYLINGFTTVGLSVDPDPPAVGYYNLFLRDNEEYCLQNSDNDIVVINGGGGSVPVATSGSGGGTIGKLTVDSNYGFSITAGVLTFNLSSTGGLEFVTGSLKTKLDGSTISSSALGIKVSDDGITNTQINSAAGITRSKLANGTNNALVRNSSSGVMTDSANLTFSEGGSNHLFVVKANAAQSTNLHEWQNSGGTVMSYVDSLGNILVPAAPTTGNMLVNKTYADALASSVIGTATRATNGDLLVVTLSENIPLGGSAFVIIDAELATATASLDWLLYNVAATDLNFIYRLYGGAHSATGTSPRVARISAGGTIGQRVIISGTITLTEDGKLTWGGDYRNSLLTQYGSALYYQSVSTTSSFNQLEFSTNQASGLNPIATGSKIVVMKLW